MSPSFYKMFGYLTGVGCLIARKQAAATLHRPSFARGTVLIASARAAADEGHGFALNPGAAAFEDGTVNSLSIPAVKIGLRHLESIGIEGIHEHVGSLTDLRLRGLQQLHHPNGVPLVHVYGPTSNDAQGGTLAMNFFDAPGSLDPSEGYRAGGRPAQDLATHGMPLQSRGGRDRLGMTEQQMASLFKARERMRFDRFLHAADAM